MKKYNISEQEIEDILRTFPRVTDTRDKHDIFQNIELAARKPKSVIRWMPAAASIAAIILFSILASSYLFDHQSSDRIADKIKYSKQENADQASKTGTSESENKKAVNPETADQNKRTDTESTDKGKLDNNSDSGMDKNQNTALQAPPLNSTLVFPADMKEHSFVTLAVPDHQVQYIVPITFETEKADKKELLNVLLEKMNTVNEESLGLTNYYPLNLGFSLGKEEGTINIDFADKTAYNNQYEFGLTDSLESTFRYQGYHKIFFSTAGKPGIELSDTGPLKEKIIDDPPKRSFLIYQADKSKPKFLVPNFSPMNSVEDALREMQSFEPVNSASPSIPADLKIENVTEGNGRLTISFSKETPLKDDESSLLAIEAILLTAKDFGLKTVLFENTGIKTLGPYDLSQEIEVPLAPNKIQ